MEEDEGHTIIINHISIEFIITVYVEQVWALNKDRGEPTLQVQEMFLGYNIQYKVADCRLVSTNNVF